MIRADKVGQIYGQIKSLWKLASFFFFLSKRKKCILEIWIIKSAGIFSSSRNLNNSGIGGFVEFRGWTKSCSVLRYNVHHGLPSESIPEYVYIIWELRLLWGLSTLCALRIDMRNEWSTLIIHSNSLPHFGLRAFWRAMVRRDIPGEYIYTNVCSDTCIWKKNL